MGILGLKKHLAHYCPSAFRKYNGATDTEKATKSNLKPEARAVDTSMQPNFDVQNNEEMGLQTPEVGRN